MTSSNAARPALGVTMVVTGGALFAVNGTVSKLVLQTGITSQQLTLVRAAGAVTTLLVLALGVVLAETARVPPPSVRLEPDNITARPDKTGTADKTRGVETRATKT